MTLHSKKQPKVGEIWSLNGAPDVPLMVITKLHKDKVYYQFGFDGTHSRMHIDVFTANHHFNF